MRVATLIGLLALVARAEEPAARIASFSPAATRILVDLGAAPHIAAATRWCELPAGHPAPRSCDAFEPDAEALRRSGATVAILPRIANPMLEARTRSVGLRTVLLSPESPDSPASDIAILAQLTGRTEQGARLIEARRNCRHPATGRRVLIVWDGVCAGPSSYLAWAIRSAGGEPAPRSGSWPQWDLFEFLNCIIIQKSIYQFVGKRSIEIDFCNFDLYSLKLTVLRDKVRIDLSSPIPSISGVLR